jgi:hypothetical protein
VFDWGESGLLEEVIRKLRKAAQEIGLAICLKNTKCMEVNEDN